MSLTSYQTAPPRALRWRLWPNASRAQPQKRVAPARASQNHRIQGQHILRDMEPSGSFADAVEYLYVQIGRLHHQAMDVRDSLDSFRRHIERGFYRRELVIRRLPME